MRRACALALLLLAGPAWADDTVYAASQQAAPLYGRLASARSAALGGAFSAVLEGADALFGNPAGLARLQGLNAGLHYQSWLADVSDETGYVAEGLGPGVGLGAYGHLTDYGTFQLRDDNGQRVGDASARDLAFGLGLGVASGPLDFGVAARVVHQDLVGEQAWGLSVDAGATWQRGGTRVGLAAVDVGTALDGSQGAESLRLGASHRFDLGSAALLPAVGVQWEPQGLSHVQAGVELQVNRALALRGGYDQALGDTLLEGLQGFTLGLGFRLGSVCLDYAYIPFGDIGAGHRISVCWQAAPRGGEAGSAADAPLAPGPAAAMAEGPPPDVLALPRHLAQDGRLGEALAELRRLTVEQKSNGAIWRELGQLEWRMNLRGQGLADLRAAQGLAPDPALEAWIHQAEAALAAPGGLEKP